MLKKIKISDFGLYKNYRSSFLPKLIFSLGFDIDWVQPNQCDLLILGPFLSSVKKYRWLPRSVRKNFDLPLWGRRSAPVTLFHTAENARQDSVQADYSIGYDLGVESENYLRFPYWMEMLDWSSQGLVGNSNHRFGGLLSIDELMKPIGENVMRRNNKAAFFTSHLRQPRKSVFDAVSKFLEVDGYGPYFNQSILDHNTSGLFKRNILLNYRFNLCPENGCFPGYYTEKIPEAFAAGCIPLTWADSNIRVDFNPLAFINLFDAAGDNYQVLGNLLNDSHYLQRLISEPLLLSKPDIQVIKIFLRKILEEAIS